MQKLKCEQTCEDFRKTLEGKLPAVPSDDVEMDWNACKDSNGNKIASEQEKVARWKECFNTVLNCEEPAIFYDWIKMNKNDCPINTAPFSVEEVVTVVR